MPVLLARSEAEAEVPPVLGEAGRGSTLLMHLGAFL